MLNQDLVELRWIYLVIRRWLWLIGSCALIAGIAAFLVTSRRPPVYYATVTMLIEPARDTRTSDVSVLAAGERLALTYSQMLKGRPVMEAAINRLGLDETPSELAKKITVEPITDTQLIRLTVQDTSPSQLALLANTIAEVFTEHIQSLQAERYTGSLASVQEKMDALLLQIDETQLRIETLNAQKIESESELDRLESLLSGQRSDFRALQEDLLALQMNVAQLTDNVSIVEEAHVSENQVQPPFTASVTLLLAGEELALTYGQMLTGQPVLEDTIKLLELDESPEILAQRIIAEPIAGTQLIKISVQDADKQQALGLADTIAGVFVDRIQTLLAAPHADGLASMQGRMDILSALIEQTQAYIETEFAKKIQVETELAQLESVLPEYRSDYRALRQDYEQMSVNATEAADAVLISEPAQAPESPVQRVRLYTLLGAVIGMMVGVGLAFLLEQMNSTFNTSDDVSQVLGLDTLGLISRLEKGENELIVVDQPRSPVAEAFRVLGTNLRLSRAKFPIHTLLVTSPTSKEGKSTIVANLAVTLSRAGLRIVAIDADLRLPRLHQPFGLEQHGGLTDSLLNGNTDGHLKTTQVEGLKILTSGEIPDNPAELVSSSGLAKMLEELGQSVDLILIDSPPVLPVADTAILASEADAVLLVLRAGHTSRQVASDAMESLRQVDAHFAGVVLNNVSNQENRYYRYYGNDDIGKSDRLQAFLQYLKNKFANFNISRKGPLIM